MQESHVPLVSGFLVGAGNKAEYWKSSVLETLYSRHLGMENNQGPRHRISHEMKSS